MSNWISEPLPAGSKIVIDHDPVALRIEIPYPSETWRRLSAIVFIASFLFGWCAAGLVAIRLSQFHSEAATGMLVWYLIPAACNAWFLYLLYQLAHPTVPQTFILKDWGLYYDSGRPPFLVEITHVWKGWCVMWNGWCVNPGPTPLRHQHEFSLPDIKTLKLSEFCSGSWLTIDQGRERIILARPATDLERKWLYDVLRDRYF